MSAVRDQSVDDAEWARLPLDPKHAEELKRSAISPVVAADRGYCTVTTQAALAREGFGRTQQILVPGLLLPSFDIAQERTYPAFKPDTPRLREGRAAKYEWPSGSTSQLDIPKRAHKWAIDREMPIVFVEGPKKSDSLASHEICAGAIGGCSNWKGDDVIASLDLLRLKGRNAYVCPDSDWRGNPRVRRAWLHFAVVLKKKGAEVLLIDIPATSEGHKQGPDDWFFNGGKYLQFWNLATELEELESVEFDDDRPVFVRHVIPNAPVLDTAVVPKGYEFSETGIEASGLPITSQPIVINARLIDVDDHSESLRLAWGRDGRWQEQVVGRGVVANARDLVGLASMGLAVTSRTSGDIVDYLSAYEAQNLATMPKARVSSRFGWQGKDGSLGFLIGRNLIRADGSEAGAINLNEVSPSDWREDWVAFHASDDGNAQVAEAFGQSGTYEDWVKAVASVSAYPRVMLALYASMATPLLSVLGASNFVVDWSFPTSTGKTTTLRLGASPWGNPNEHARASVVGTWDATRVYIERTSAILDGLPLILDDTKQAKVPKVVAQTIYDVVSGRGRGRGSTQGIRKSGSWSTILLSSGEAPATSFTEDGGTRARTMVLWGLPFGQANSATGVVVNELNLALRNNYGHAGPKFVRHLLEHRSRWDEWRAEHRCIESEYLRRAGDNPVAGRFAGYFAILDMASLLTHDALDLPWECKDPVEALWVDLVHEATDADRAKSALAMVLSWSHSNEHTFDGRLQTDNNVGYRIPNQGITGKWESSESWSFIAFFPHKIKELLTASGFDAEAVVRTWRDRDWLDLDSDRKRMTKQIRINGEKSWAVVVNRSAFDLAGES